MKPLTLYEFAKLVQEDRTAVERHARRDYDDTKSQSQTRLKRLAFRLDAVAQSAIDADRVRLLREGGEL